jgi:hypothetical protein
VTAKEIIKNVCIYLGKEDILESSFFDPKSENVPPDVQKEVDKIVKCINDITEELAMQYIPILKTNVVDLEQGAIDVYAIDKNICEIVSVKTLNGRTLRYVVSGNKMVCLASKVEVTYKVYPEKINAESDAESFGGKISARVLAYGVASEYCFLDMLYDDATLWENRYKNALLHAQRKKGELKLKKRGWL